MGGTPGRQNPRVEARLACPHLKLAGEERARQGRSPARCGAGADPRGLEATRKGSDPHLQSQREISMRAGHMCGWCQPTVLGVGQSIQGQEGHGGPSGAVALPLERLECGDSEVVWD